jgi:ATP diphosphatase
LEEIEEVDNAQNRSEIEDEVGDVLYAAVNLARHHEVDPETALRAANAKFERRFRAMEAKAGDGFASLPLNEKEALWQAVKRDEG